MALFGQIGEQFSTVISRFTLNQKITIVAVLLLTIGGIFGVVHWASRPDYVPLFSNLPAIEAGKIENWLQEEDIPYVLDQGGGQIKIPREHLYHARIQLAQEGLPGQRATGYEIFDQTNLGMSEFVQKLNYRRALEGELSRTVEELEEVERARIHIVIPEPALFREKEKPTTASVVLKLRRSLSENQVAGITHLIASAVEGLEITEVTILDSRGDLLSDMRERDPLIALSATQMKIKEEVEQNLTKKVETMLDGLLGQGKSIVRVAIDLDFSRSETTSEIFDPEQTAVRSEETIESSIVDQGQQQVNPIDPTQPPLGSSSQTTEVNNVTNYEVSKTVSHISSQTGGITRMSAAVIIDGVYETVTGEDGGTELVYRDRTQEEMVGIEEAVRGALGYNEIRDDQISVINIAFQVPVFEEPPISFIEYLKDNWYSILQKLLLGGAVIGILYYVRKLLQKSADAARLLWEQRMAEIPGAVPGALPGAIGEGLEPLALPDIEGELPPDVLEQKQLQQQLMEYAKDKPEPAARLLKTWLVETGG